MAITDDEKDRWQRREFYMQRRGEFVLYVNQKVVKTENGTWSEWVPAICIGTFEKSFPEDATQSLDVAMIRADERARDFALTLGAPPATRREVAQAFLDARFCLRPDPATVEEVTAWALTLLRSAGYDDVSVRVATAEGAVGAVHAITVVGGAA